MPLFLSHPAVAADWVSDELLTDYVVSILDRDLHWERDSYIRRIVNGIATSSSTPVNGAAGECAAEAIISYTRSRLI
jgi:hypothetical protein